MLAGVGYMLRNRWVHAADFAPLLPRMLLCRFRLLPRWKEAWPYLTAFIYSLEMVISLGNHFG